MTNNASTAELFYYISKFETDQSIIDYGSIHVALMGNYTFLIVCLISIISLMFLLAFRNVLLLNDKINFAPIAILSILFALYVTPNISEYTFEKSGLKVLEKTIELKKNNPWAFNELESFISIKLDGYKNTRSYSLR